MHMHSHFSFNAFDYSPAQLIDEAARHGLYAVAICDFDVLDGLREFQSAADAVGMRVAVGMETRVFFAEYGDVSINSPGEPGVYYFMGMGFGKLPAADSAAGRTLRELRDRSRDRNMALIRRIGEAIPELSLDYQRDVLPLTPSGNATERHIVKALIAKAEAGDAKRIWSKTLGATGEKLDALLADGVALQNTVRSKLMKAGGPGYVKPDRDTFPPLEQVVSMIIEAGGIPMATWLDGTSEGEKDIRAQLECLRSKGIAALNIVPDRNWNIKDAETKRIKVEKLNEVVQVAVSMKMPVNVGTELNSFGQPFVDDFQAEPMRPHWPVFFHGAQVMVGQARLSRFADYSYCGARAAADWPDPGARNDFFAKVGALPCPNAGTLQALIEAGSDKGLRLVKDAVKAGNWTASGI
jgi:hypothetical protein